MIQFSVNRELCTGCGECAADCPSGIIVLDDYPKITDEARCIRCQHCLAVCPEGAVSILGRDPKKSISLSGSPLDPAHLELLIRGRRTVRRYTGRNLPEALIDELLNTACHAPTGINSQSVLFSVVRDGAVMAALREAVMKRLAALKEKEEGKLPAGFAGQYMHMALKAWQEQGRDIIFRGAPHLLLTSAPADAACPVQDTHIALATFQLMAHARGVGTVWDGIFMIVLSLLPDLPKQLGIPGNHILGYAMAFGEPAVEYHRTVQRGPAQINLISSL